MSDSSPTSGASILGSLSESKPQNLPLNVPLNVEAADALAMAGNALLLAARALRSVTHQGELSTPLSVVTGPVTFPADFSNAPTCAEVVNELLIVKTRARRSDEYVKNLRIYLRRFVQAVQNAPLHTIPPQRIEKWVDRLAQSERSKKSHLDSVRLLFNFAAHRGYVRSNPAAAVELPLDESQFAPPAIHTPEQVRHVLNVTRRGDLNLCRFLAVRYFAGLRASEAQQCKVELERGFIEVTALAAKTRKRRLVTIQPNLAEWLKLGGELPVRNLNTRMATLKSIVPWTANVTRHSFVSYHLAQFQNAAKTALEAGHSEAMLFAYYRELVTMPAAKEFWSIVPSTGS